MDLTQTGNNSDQASRLRELRRKSGLTMREVADAVGLSHSRISHYEQDSKARIRVGTLQKLAHIYKTTIEFIEKGEKKGQIDIFGHPMSDEYLTSIRRGDRLKDQGIWPHGENDPGTDFLSVRAVSVQSRGRLVEWFRQGGGYMPAVGTMNVYYPAVELDSPHGAMCFEVDGDNMEPQLRAGMWVAGPAIPPENFKYTTSGVYAVQFGDTLVIKRVKDNDLLRDGTLTLHSDNPRGGSLAVAGEDIRGMWRVVQIVIGRVE